MGNISIIGAGMAGLLAGRLLARHRPTILEAQPSLPNNHSAVLRFRSPIVADVTGIPFRRVTMVRGNLPHRNPVADTLAYSFKNTGQFRSDRSITDGLIVGDRWIAPPDFIAQLASDLDIKFGAKDAIAESLHNPTISTIPMPALMDFLDYPHKSEVAFNSRPGTNIIAEIFWCDAYASLMVPHPAKLFSRISVTGNELIIELPGISEIGEAEAGEITKDAMNLIGLTESSLKSFKVRPQKYAKIDPIDDRLRKDFMFWATDKFNIYSLGRFATWRPGLLLDDLVQDIRLIERWILSDNKYELAKKAREV